MRIPICEQALFIKRDTRFSAMVEHKGKLRRCYVANSGRLAGVLEEKRKVWIYFKKHPKTECELFAVDVNGVFVVVDSRVPNLLFEEAVRSGRLKEFEGFEIKREYRIKRGRIDFLLLKGEKRVYVEIKGCTLAVEGIAMFPDAPTERGRRHVEELSTLVKDKNKAAYIVFIAQRDDVRFFSPAEHIDREFAKLLREGVKNGVKVLCYKSRVEGEMLSLGDKIPLKL